MNKVVTRIKGGLGNQLFCYAAARRLAVVNDAELVIDDVSGFIRDRLYHRQYMLDHFNICARKATYRERLEPFGRYRRYCLSQWSRFKPFEERRYLVQEQSGFDDRFLNIRLSDTIYLDGLWESENYFKDVEYLIREDLRIIPPTDETNLKAADKIINSNAIAIHVRCFDSSNYSNLHPNLSNDYYSKAVAFMEARVESPFYYLFSDNPMVADSRLSFPKDRSTFISHNKGDVNAYADLWLMSLCNNFITANSTFSWWGAWLCSNRSKIVIMPGEWADLHNGLLPCGWIKL